MSDAMSREVVLYRELLADIKVRVRQAQHRAVLSANAEMILMYWDIGRMIAARQVGAPDGASKQHIADQGQLVG